MKAAKRTFVFGSILIFSSGFFAPSLFASYNESKNGIAYTRFQGNLEGRMFGQLSSKIAKTSTSFTNGVQINYTTNDQAVVTFLQSFNFHEIFSKFGDVVFVVSTNISNGVQITTTSTNSAIVAKLQDFANKASGKNMQGKKESFTSIIPHHDQKNIVKKPSQLTYIKK